MKIRKNDSAALVQKRYAAAVNSMSRATTDDKYGHHRNQYNQNSRTNAKKEAAFRLLLLGEPGGIRTHDLLIRSQTLYPAELRAHTPL